MIYNNVTRNWTNYNYIWLHLRSTSTNKTNEKIKQKNQKNMAEKLRTRYAWYLLHSKSTKVTWKSFFWGFLLFRRCGGPNLSFCWSCNSKQSNRSAIFQSWHLFIINFISFSLSLSIWSIAVADSQVVGSLFQCDFNFSRYILCSYFIFDRLFALFNLWLA